MGKWYNVGPFKDKICFSLLEVRQRMRRRAAASQLHSCRDVTPTRIDTPLTVWIAVAFHLPHGCSGIPTDRTTSNKQLSASLRFTGSHKLCVCDAGDLNPAPPVVAT